MRVHLRSVIAFFSVCVALLLSGCDWFDAPQKAAPPAPVVNRPAVKTRTTPVPTPSPAQPTAGPRADKLAVTNPPPVSPGGDPSGPPVVNTASSPQPTQPTTVPLVPATSEPSIVMKPAV